MFQNMLSSEGSVHTDATLGEKLFSFSQCVWLVITITIALSSADNSMTSPDRTVTPDRARFWNANGFANRDLGLELANIDLKYLKVLKHSALLWTLSPFG